jgi:hypothetical protein
MKSVYVVSIAEDYVGLSTIGAYSYYDDAVAAADKEVVEGSFYDVVVHEWRGDSRVLVYSMERV